MSQIVKLIVAIAMCWVALAIPTWAIDDTPENRSAQADYYLRVVPAQSLMNDMSEKMAARLPEGQRELFVTLMTKNLDMGVVTKTMRSAMIKNFSADELKAIADFYGSPIGKSAMSKFGNYMADAMTPLQAELARAMTLTQEQMKPK